MSDLLPPSVTVKLQQQHEEIQSLTAELEATHGKLADELMESVELLEEIDRLREALFLARTVLATAGYIEILPALDKALATGGE